MGCVEMSKCLADYRTRPNRGFEGREKKERSFGKVFQSGGDFDMLTPVGWPHKMVQKGG
jgi:hypothetical protein